MNKLNNILTMYPGGEAQYSFRMFAVYEQPICCTIADPRVVKCIFSKVDTADPFDPVWQLRIRLGPVHSIEEVDEIGNAIKDGIFDQLSFAFKIKIDQIRMTGHSLMPMPGGGGSAYLILPMMIAAAEGRGGGRQLSADDVQALQANLAKPHPLPNPLVALYRSALGADDPVVKFLMLYLILYELSGNRTQSRVENLIQKYAPSTVMNRSLRTDKSERERGIKETIYTRLRNEITHRIAANPEETRREILSNLDAFQTIIHQALTSKMRATEELKGGCQFSS